MTRKGMVLKPEYQDMADAFASAYDGEGCRCFICPPCSFCTHEGNPANLVENDDAWDVSQLEK